MVAFATGGLLGDTFLHLIPHSFFGEHHDEPSSKSEHQSHQHTSSNGVHFIMLEERRNVVIGLAIFLGMFIESQYI